MDVLFKTLHGSRLYGLSNDSSDYDYYTVVSKRELNRNARQYRARYAKQTIVGDQDSMVVDIGTFLDMCSSGVPQACEAMMSNMAEVDKIAALRSGFRFGTQVYERYLRTIKSFALSEDAGTKKRRHALRLALNLAEIGRTGRFNPTLSQEDVEYINMMATKSHEDVYGLALCLAW